MMVGDHEKYASSYTKYIDAFQLENLEIIHNYAAWQAYDTRDAGLIRSQEHEGDLNEEKRF